MNAAYDAIVIGGGMTGGYAAKNLCEAGLKVLLLERGPARSHPPNYIASTKKPWDFPYRGVLDDTLLKQQGVQSNNYAFTPATAAEFVNDQANPYSTPKDKPFTWFRSYQLGGKSLLWGRQCYRWSEMDFNANARENIAIPWPIGYSDLARYYEEVEQFIGVSGSRENMPQLPDGHFLPPMAMNDMELEFKRRVQKRWPGRKMIIGRTANLTKNHNGRGACIYRNRCAEGCPQGGYYSSLSGAIPAALATGNLTIRCDAIVERLIYDKVRAKATAVSVIDANTKEKSEYAASVIFVCAGTLNSTWLLLNSADANGVGTESGQLGHNLMDHHHMSVSSVLAAGVESFPQGRRPTACYLPRFRNLDGDDKAGFKRGYAFFVSVSREDWRRGLMDEGLGADWKDSLSSWGAWRVSLMGYGETLPSYKNRVELDYDSRDAWGLPTLKISAEFTHNEKVMNQDMVASAVEMLSEIGGDKPEIWQQQSNPGFSVHEMGTARMGKDRKTSVLDPWNRMWEAPNVFVTDGSAMVSSACQNPSLTYMAMTVRACAKAVKELNNV